MNPDMNKDGPQTHEEAVEFVKHDFQSMGGTVTEMPPHRPNKRNRVADRDAFFIHFENDVLRNNWNNWEPFPTGPRRFENPEWAKMIKSQVFPHHSDIDWYEYVECCHLGVAMNGFKKRSSN